MRDCAQKGKLLSRDIREDIDFNCSPVANKCWIKHDKKFQLSKPFQVLFTVFASLSIDNTTFAHFTAEITKLQFFSSSLYRFFKRCERISTRQDTKRTQFANISYAFTIRCLIVDWLHQLKRIVALNSMSLVCARLGLWCAQYIQLRIEHCISHWISHSTNWKNDALLVLYVCCTHIAMQNASVFS